MTDNNHHHPVPWQQRVAEQQRESKWYWPGVLLMSPFILLGLACASVQWARKIAVRVR